MGHFVHLVDKVFDVFPRFVLESHFLQGLDKGANGRRFELLLLLEDGAKNLGPGGVIPEVFFNGLTEVDHDRHENSLSAPSKIFAVKVAYM